MRYEWDFASVFRESDMFIDGFFGTLKISALALILGLVIGLIAAILRLSKNKILNVPAGIYIEVLRSTPPLIQLFWVFYGLPILIRVDLEAFEAAVITLSFQSGAFFAEIYRGGILSIERDQWEAGRALGMNYLTLMRRIILPQAVNRMIPAFMNRAIELMKTTTLVATIGFADLLYQAMLVSQRLYRPLEAFTMAAAFYFIILFFCSLAVRTLEARVAKSGQ